MSYEITNRILGDGHNERVYDVTRINVSMLLSKTVCDWFAINETLKVLEGLGVVLL